MTHTPDPAPRALLVDSEALPLGAEAEYLAARGVDATRADGVGAALAALRDRVFDVILATEQAGHPALLAATPAVPKLWVCRALTEAATAKRLQVPRAAIVGLPTDLADLPARLVRVGSEARLTGFADGDAPSLIGNSPAWQRAAKAAETVAAADAPVLLTGPTGTGKSALARHMHRHSPRRDSAFRVVNLPGVPPDLQLSELFGHVRGAFTGADRDRHGAFQLAYGGSLFIDEVADLTVEAQTSLLRALQDRVVKAAGAEHEVPINVRLISATHRDLRELVHARTFREDLFYRIVSVEIELPSLAARSEDILPLARSIADRVRKTPVTFAAELVAWMQAHPWPGNIRELEKFIECGIVFLGQEETELCLNHFRNSPSWRSDPVPRGPVKSQTWEQYLQECKRDYLLQLMELYQNDWDAIARHAGVEQARTVRSWGKELGLL